MGSDEQVTRYMMLDLEGGATILSHTQLIRIPMPSMEMVTSLDWTPGRIRYQVDRKVLQGTKTKGLAQSPTRNDDNRYTH